MDNLTLLKALHGIAVLLLFGGAAGLAAWAWRGRRAGHDSLAQTFRGPVLLAWLAMLLGLVGLPVSGWWLTHLAGWPLGQTWLLGGALLYLLGTVCWLLAAGRFRRLEQVAGPSRQRTQRFALGYSALSLLAFVAIVGVMVSKPI